MPGPSSPDGVATRVSWPPSLAASTLIFSTACCIPPSCMASAWAASLPECISRPCSSWLTVNTPPALTPTLVPSAAAITAPLSRSATSQASADTSFGSGGVLGAATTPQLPSASPPTGLAGTARGIGGSPAVGTSEESTAGGVDTLYGQFGRPASGPGLGSANAVGRPGAIGAASTKTAAARHDAERKKVIVSAE